MSDDIKVKDVQKTETAVSAEDAYATLKQHIGSAKTTVGESVQWTLPGAADFNPKTVEKQLRAASEFDRKEKARDIKAYVTRLKVLQSVFKKLEGRDLREDLDDILQELSAEQEKVDSTFESNMKTILSAQRELESTVRGLDLFFSETMIDNPTAVKCIAIANANAEEAGENFEALGSEMPAMADTAQLEEVYDMAVFPKEFWGRGEINDLGTFAHRRNMMVIGEAPGEYLNARDVDKFHDLSTNTTPFRHVVLTANRCVARRASKWEEEDVTTSPSYAFAGKMYQLDKGKESSVATVASQQRHPMSSKFEDWETKINFYDKITDCPIVYGVKSTASVLHFDNAATMAGREVTNQYQNQRVLLFLKKVITAFLRAKKFSPKHEAKDIGKDLERYMQQLAGADPDKMVRTVSVSLQAQNEEQLILGVVPFSLEVGFKDAIANFAVEISRGADDAMSDVN